MLPKLLLISEEFSCVSVPSKRDVIGREYIIEHNYHEHYMHAEGLSVNNYVRKNSIRQVNVRQYLNPDKTSINMSAIFLKSVIMI